MRRLALVAAITIVAGGWYVFHDVGHIPMFDANLNRLAETAQEGYCAGIVFWTNNTQPDAEKAEACREESARSTDPDLRAVVPAFCQGIVEEGYEGGQARCELIVLENEWWPTRDGGLAYAWNRANPWPGDRLLIGSADDGSRTGDREGFSR